MDEVMLKLHVQLLEEGAKLPVCSRPGEDLGYDVFALEDVCIAAGEIMKVRTGIAVSAVDEQTVKVYSGYYPKPRYEYGLNAVPLGLIVKDRSSMAAKGVLTHGGVIDAGYRGEVIILMSYVCGSSGEGKYTILKGDKIAQLVPVPVLTGHVSAVEAFADTTRGGNGFGSSGR